MSPLPGQLELPIDGKVEDVREAIGESERDVREAIREGERLREQGIAQAEGGAPAVALWEAVAVVRLLALRHRTLTTDDVWKRLEAIGALTLPEPRALGAVMRRAQRQGYVEPTEEWRLSVRPACHRRPLRIWRSLLWDTVPHSGDATGGSARSA